MTQYDNDSDNSDDGTRRTAIANPHHSAGYVTMPAPRQHAVFGGRTDADRNIYHHDIGCPELAEPGTPSATVDLPPDDNRLIGADPCPVCVDDDGDDEGDDDGDDEGEQAAVLPGA